MNKESKNNLNLINNISRDVSLIYKKPEKNYFKYIDQKNLIEIIYEIYNSKKIHNLEH